MISQCRCMFLWATDEIILFTEFKEGNMQIAHIFNDP